MINLYLVKIEAHEDDRPVFQLEAFDDDCATLRVDTLVDESTLPELFEAITEGVKMLKLKKTEDIE